MRNVVPLEPVSDTKQMAKKAEPKKDNEYFNRIIVVTRDYQQYKYYTGDSPIFVYLDRPEKIMGYDKFVVLYVGEWWLAPNFGAIEDAIDSRRGVIKIKH